MQPSSCLPLSASFSNPPSGSADWWQAVKEASHQFQEPLALPQTFDDQWLSEQDMKEILCHLLGDTAADKNLRLYVDGGQRPDALGRLLTRPPADHESVDEWAQALLPSGRYGMVINKAERFHPTLGERLARFFMPLLEQDGLPPGGFEVGVFIGNYEASPFGVHHDRDQSVVFHFQVGPGRKAMHCWSRADYLRIHGSADSCFDWEHLRMAATTTEFGKGDCYVLPCEGYHVGQSSCFSMGLAVALVDQTPQQRLEKALATVAGRLAETLPSEPQPYAAWEGGESGVAWAGVPDRATPLADLVADADEENQCVLRSNVGFQPQGDSVLQATSDQGLIEVVHRVEPFPILCRATRRGTMQLFARGHCFELPRHDRLPQLTAWLNEGRSVTIGKAQELLSPEWPETALEQVFEQLVAHRALEVV